MKALTSLLLVLAFAATPNARAAITIPGADGSDGALNITEDTVIDLSQAVLGDGVTVKWDSNNAANAGKGIYDPKQWAVVFKYSSVNIATGATVTFKNHASRAPVMWLVNGDVTIDGTVALNGKQAAIDHQLSEPGPGGFRGGAGWFGPGAGGGTGLGPSGGYSANLPWSSPAGSYGSVGSQGGEIYGNPSMIPLIGGSGGAASTGNIGHRFSGGAGGGAILVACTNKLTLDGSLVARGGAPAEGSIDPWHWSGAGSGGGIRLICDELAGTGTLAALGGISYKNHLPGGLGRIRIERRSNSGAFAIAPDPSVLEINDAEVAIIVPPADGPEVKIISVETELVPDDPRAEFGAIGADIQLPLTGSVLVTIETKNVEQESQVKVRNAPLTNNNAVIVDATIAEVVSADPIVIRWTANVSVHPGYSEIGVHVIRP